MIGWLAILPASAGSVEVTFCAEYRVDFFDVADNYPDLEDDYFLDNSDVPARGAYLRITDNDWQTTSDVQVDEETGCGTWSMFDNHDYDIRLLSQATIDTIDILVWTSSSSNAIWSTLLLDNWTPTAGTHYLETNVNTEVWNLAAAAGWAIYRRSGSLSYEQIDMYAEQCPTQVSSCYTPSGHDVYIDPGGNADLLKFTIAHELGHFVAAASNGFDGMADHSGGGGGNCVFSKGLLQEKAWASHAAVEGIAWYYAAVAFNNTTEYNCELYSTGDFNHDGFIDALENETTPSCEGDPSTEDWANLDYLGNECTGTITDRGTRLDWMRAFWDADQGQGLSTTQILDIWDRANPNSWDINNSTGSGTDDPKEMFEWAAGQISATVQQKWNNVDDINGLR